MNGSAGLSTYIFRQSYEEEINPFYRQSIQWCSAAGWDDSGSSIGSDVERSAKPVDREAAVTGKSATVFAGK